MRMLFVEVVHHEGYEDKELTPRLENDMNPKSGHRNQHNLHGDC